MNDLKIQVKHNGRLYRNRNGVLEITRESGRHFSVPYILYKYYPLNKFTVEAITKHYLFASSPKHLNDRFDCDPQLVSFNSLEDELSATKKILPNALITEEDLYYLSEFGLNYFLVEYCFKRWGIISMTGNCEEILMWSHYAKNDGICVGYYTDRLPWEWVGPFPIEYVRSRNTALISSHQITLLPLLLCFQKNTEWKYEKEYRYLVKLKRGLSRRCSYGTDAIAHVYIGRGFIEQDEMMIDEENFHVIIEANKRKDIFRRKILDTIANYGTPIFYDLTHNIDEIHYEPYYLYGQNGHYDFCY